MGLLFAVNHITRILTVSEVVVTVKVLNLPQHFRIRTSGTVTFVICYVSLQETDTQALMQSLCSSWSENMFDMQGIATVVVRVLLS